MKTGFGYSLYKDMLRALLMIRVLTRGIFLFPKKNYIGAFVFYFSSLVFPHGAIAAESKIAVLYPNLGEPYKSMFLQIIQGVEDQTNQNVIGVAVSSTTAVSELTANLSRENVRVVISLGRIGLKFATALSRDTHIIAAGVISLPESEAHSFTVYSLAPDPALLLERLKNFMPSAKRVFVVYDPRQNSWLIRRAMEAAQLRGMELITYEAQDLKSALRAYIEILNVADPKKDALWLPQDSTTVDETTVLPLLLQNAWDKNLLFFSSSVVHVKRGALFSLYPDNSALGHQLGAAALKQLSTGSSLQKGIMPLKAVLIAVNVRTASHLGLNLTAKRQDFDIIFPEQ